MELVIPTWSFAEESSAKAYMPASGGQIPGKRRIEWSFGSKII